MEAHSSMMVGRAVHHSLYFSCSMALQFLSVDGVFVRCMTRHGVTRRGRAPRTRGPRQIASMDRCPDTIDLTFLDR